MTGGKSDWEDRFWSFVQKEEEEGGCWWWTRHLDTGGYGIFHANGRYHQAHRLAFALLRGAVSPSKFLLHQCDVKWQPGEIEYRRCVNPDHLVEGGARRNAIEREAKGRGYHGPRRLGPIIKKSQPRKAWEERFWLRVQKSGDDDCWFWTGGTNTKNYGNFYVGGKTVSAHRMAYILAHGAIAPDDHVLHTCDIRYAPGDIQYRKCVNAHHLRIGNHQINMQEMMEKGRVASGERNGLRLHPERVARGDRSGARLHNWERAKGIKNTTYVHAGTATKLTPEKAAALREMRKEGKTINELATFFGISQTQAYRIASGKRWIYNADGTPVHIDEAVLAVSKRPRQALSEDQVKQALELLNQGRKRQEVGAILEVKGQTISLIALGKYRFSAELLPLFPNVRPRRRIPSEQHLPREKEDVFLG